MSDRFQQTKILIHVLALALVCSSLGHSQDAPEKQPKASPVTTSVADVSIEKLRLIVKPMTADELKVEIDGWLQLVREKGEELALKKAEALETREQKDAQIEKGEQADSDAKKEELESRELILQQTNDLRNEELALLDRLEAVLESYEKKGGEVEQIRQYATVQRGVQVDPADWRAIWLAAKGWLYSEEGGKNLARRLLAFVLILFVTRIVASIVARASGKLLDRTSKLSQLAEKLISKCIRNVIFLLGLLIAVAALGVDIGPLLAAVGATGFIVGFALQGTLSNFASGLMILVNRPFDVGDIVTAGGITGTISEMNLVSTTFSTFDNQKIIVPNNEIWDNVITNVTARKTRRVDLQFGVGYDDDLARVEEILKEAVSQHPLVLQDPEPTIKLNELADSSVNFICRPWAKTSDYWAVYWDITKTVKQRFDEAGISIPYPQTDVHVKADLLEKSSLN